jgi:hypothetical protein
MILPYKDSLHKDYILLYAQCQQIIREALPLSAGSVLPLESSSNTDSAFCRARHFSIDYSPCGVYNKKADWRGARAVFIAPRKKYLPNHALFVL